MLPHLGHAGLIAVGIGATGVGDKTISIVLTDVTVDVTEHDI